MPTWICPEFLIWAPARALVPNGLVAVYRRFLCACQPALAPADEDGANRAPSLDVDFSQARFYYVAESLPTPRCSHRKLIIDLSGSFRRRRSIGNTQTACPSNSDSGDAGNTGPPGGSMDAGQCSTGRGHPHRHHHRRHQQLRNPLLSQGGR